MYIRWPNERREQAAFAEGRFNRHIAELDLQGRMETRLPIIVVVLLAHAAVVAEIKPEERTYTDNISPCGARVFSKRAWQPGDLVRIAPINEESFPGRVVYCQRLPDDRYCFGVKFEFGPVAWSILQRYARP